MDGVLHPGLSLLVFYSGVPIAKIQKMKIYFFDQVFCVHGANNIRKLDKNISSPIFTITTNSTLSTGNSSDFYNTLVCLYNHISTNGNNLVSAC
jgi:hypothetical protein